MNQVLVRATGAAYIFSKLKMAGGERRACV